LRQQRGNDHGDSGGCPGERPDVLVETEHVAAKGRQETVGDHPGDKHAGDQADQDQHEVLATHAAGDLATAHARGAQGGKLAGPLGDGDRHGREDQRERQHPTEDQHHANERIGACTNGRSSRFTRKHLKVIFRFLYD
jgi:hypothetical protein